MDRLVDHLLVMEGDGIVRDFPGNYSKYREVLKAGGAIATIEEKKQVPLPEVPTTTDNPSRVTEKRKLSFKQKNALRTIEQEIESLTREKQSLTAQLDMGNLAYPELDLVSRRIGEITTLLDQKELHWLQLSETS
jgi:ABC transport system ATP-binding/permease protein